MRLLHTADWHLGDRLGRIDRTADLRRGVERVAEYCRSEQVDVLLVAGDIFSELARPDSLREAVRHLKTTFDPFLRGGGTILAVTGNHDNENFCQTLRHAMGLAAPAAGIDGLAPPGRLYLADEPSLLRLPGRDGDVQFVMMPYPSPTRYLDRETLQRYRDLDEKRRFLQAAFAGRLELIRASTAFRRDVPSVLVAHVNVQGAQADWLFHMSPDEDVVCPDEAVLHGFAYVALGHIHKPHHLPGRPHVRYCGSIERLDLGESLDSKGVELLDIAACGLAAPPRTLPLDATPIYTVAINNPADELANLPQRFADRDCALVKLDIRFTAGRDALESVLHELDTIFPRWYERCWTETDALGGPISVGPPPTARGFHEVVREYLKAELAHHDEPTRDAVLARAEQLLAGGA